MKRSIIQLAVVVVCCLAMAGDAEGRGGRGGGGFSGGGGGRSFGGGGGGYSRSAPSFSRPAPSRPAPSRPSQPISRPSGGIGTQVPRPSLPSTGARPSVQPRPSTGPGGRPTPGDVSGFLDLPRPSTGGGGLPSNLPSNRPGISNLPAGAGGAAGEFLRNNPATQPGTRPGIADRPNVGDRPNIGDRPNAGDRPFVNNRPDRIDNRDQWKQNRQDRRNEVVDQIRDHHYDHNHWFGGDFWQDHPNLHWHYHNGVNWWGWATWASVAGWVNYGWSDPVYYNYGDNVYYQGDTVYYGDEPVYTADQYAQQAETLANSAPEVNQDTVQWLPLGVFAMTQDGVASSAEPTMFLQLAVSKEGVISGTYQNTSSNTVESIEGMVDKATQRTAWCVVGKQWPIMETGIQNLTQDTAPCLIHFADGQTQQWLLVRLPDEQQKQQPPQ